MPAGTMTNKICFSADENLYWKAFLSSIEYANDRDGNIAVESETAKELMSKDDKWLDKLKMATLPVASVEAMAVMTMVFNCEAPSPKDLGAINFKVFNTPGCFILKLGRQENPECKKEGIWTAKCNSAPNTTP